MRCGSLIRSQQLRHSLCWRQKGNGIVYAWNFGFSASIHLDDVPSRHPKLVTTVTTPSSDTQQTSPLDRLNLPHCAFCALLPCISHLASCPTYPSSPPTQLTNQPSSTSSVQSACGVSPLYQSPTTCGWCSLASSVGRQGSNTLLLLMQRWSLKILKIDRKDKRPSELSASHPLGALFLPTYSRQPLSASRDVWRSAHTNALPLGGFGEAAGPRGAHRSASPSEWATGPLPLH